VTKRATYRCAGYPEGVALFVFTCWKSDGTGCGCFSVRGSVELGANIKALKAMGYSVGAE
jgi:hypothetical protein